MKKRSDWEVESQKDSLDGEVAMIRARVDRRRSPMRVIAVEVCRWKVRSQWEVESKRESRWGGGSDLSKKARTRNVGRGQKMWMTNR